MKTIPLRRQMLLAASALAFAAPLGQATAAGWGFSDLVRGNGNIKEQARQVGHFSGVSLAVPGEVELRIGNSEGLTIQTDDNLLPLIDTVVEDGILSIRPSKNNLDLSTGNLKIVVNARNIDRLAVAGSGSINADPLRGSTLRFKLAGSGSINVKAIDSDMADVKLGGGGGMKVGGGNVRTLSVKIGGSGDVDMGQVKAGRATVKVAGSGTATLWAQDSLDLKAVGSGEVNYYGDPRVTQSTLGSGAVRRLGPAPR